METALHLFQLALPTQKEKAKAAMDEALKQEAAVAVEAPVEEEPTKKKRKRKHGGGTAAAST